MTQEKSYDMPAPSSLKNVISESEYNQALLFVNSLHVIQLAQKPIRLHSWLCSLPSSWQNKFAQPFSIPPEHSKIRVIKSYGKWAANILSLSLPFWETLAQILKRYPLNKTRLIHCPMQVYSPQAHFKSNLVGGANLRLLPTWFVHLTVSYSLNKKLWLCTCH